MIKELMSYPKCRSVTVINNAARPGSNHREVNYINYNNINNNNNNNNNNKNNKNNNNNNNHDDDLKRTLRYKIIKED
jgi:exopolyphosphatase/pppGpp-phosphohydrolase